MSARRLERLYRLGLFLYPRAFREQLEEPMVADFRALLAAQEDRRGRLRATLWELVDLARGALALRLGRGGPRRRRRRNLPAAGLATELRATARAMARRPAGSAAAALSLTVALGAVTAVFSVLYGVVLRPLPYRAPEQLAFVWDGLDWVGIPRAWVAPAEVVDLRERTSLFEGFAAIDTVSYQVTGIGEALQVPGGEATADLFDLLGVRAALGRTFAPGDDQPGAEPVAVLTWGFWREHFGGDAGVVGRGLRLDGVEHTVVGVLPREIDFEVHTSLGRPQEARVWRPLAVDLAAGGRNNHGLAVLARVRDGVTLEQARSELARVSEDLDREHYGGRGFAFRLAPLHRDLVADSRASLWLLLGAAGFLLLLAASNVATLLLAEAQVRGRDLAVRLALGARGWRLYAPTLVGSLALAAAALGGGLLLARAGIVSIRALVGDRLPRMDEVGLEPGVVAVSAAAALAVGGCCALLPILELRGRTRARVPRAGGDPGRSATRRALVVAQMAAALVLGAGAVMLTRSVWNLQRADYGFEPEGAVAARLVLPAERYPETADLSSFAGRLLTAVRAVPGITEAGIGSSLPLAADTSQTTALRGDVDPGLPGEAYRSSEATLVDFVGATPGYLEALGIELLAGRGLRAGDAERAEDERVALIDDQLATRFFGSVEVALGRTVRPDDTPRTVVGVVAHARFYDARSDDRPQVYLAYPDRPFRGLAVVARSGLAPDLALEAIRAAARSLDPAQPLYDLRPYRERLDAAVAGDRLVALLVGAFGAAALVLAAVGVFGLLGVLVGQRSAEVGVRVALGAGRAQVAWLVLGQTARVAVPGVALGLALAVALRGVLASSVYGVGASDPAALVGSAVALLAVALAASGPPLLRALRLDPARTLRDPG